MANRFGQLAKNKKEEQAEIKASVGVAEKEERNTPKRNKDGIKNTSPLMLYITEQQKEDLKIYAARNKKSVAELVRELIVNEIYK